MAGENFRRLVQLVVNSRLCGAGSQTAACRVSIASRSRTAAVAVSIDSAAPAPRASHRSRSSPSSHAGSWTTPSPFARYGYPSPSRPFPNFPLEAQQSLGGDAPLPAPCAFAACASTMPAAGSRHTARVNRSTLSTDSSTCGRPPLIRITAFNAPPPHLPPAPLMDLDFAALGQLLRRRRPFLRFFSIGARLCSTLPAGPAWQRCPCVSLSLLLHQDVKRACASNLPFMHGVPK